MFSYRNNAKLKSGTASFTPKNPTAPPAAAAGGHGSGGDRRGPGNGDPPNPPRPGDVIYGARKIAAFIFGDDSDRARRRVFNLAAHYRARGEQAGFFRLKGALCLFVSVWLKFHGLA